MSTTASAVGSFVSWSGGCLFIGRAAVQVPVHAHYAIQLAFGFEHGIGFRTTDREPWVRYGGAMIPSRQPHSMDATTVSGNAVMFVEPETREGRVLHERYLNKGIMEMPAEALAQTRLVVDAWLSGDRQAIVTASMGLINALTGGVEPASPSDERILRAVGYINAHLDGKLTLEEVAEQAFLSPSRFRHLFVEQTGMALRPYILWRRFLKVWELSMEGQSLSAVAHAAGFADAAHLSRTSRRMFGLTPSMLRTNRPPLVEAEQ